MQNRPIWQAVAQIPMTQKYPNRLIEFDLSMIRKRIKRVRVNPGTSPAVIDDELIDEALQAAVGDDVRKHKQAGQPLVVWKDGQIALVSATEVEAEMQKQRRPIKKRSRPRKTA